jgi:hypothetical protein
MKAPDKNFKLPKSVKRILSAIEDKEQRRLWKDAFISAEMNDAPRMTMNYDIGVNGKPPRKVMEKQNANG